MNIRPMYVGVLALATALALAGCGPKDDKGEATAASAYVQECKLIGANTVHVVGKVLGTSKYDYLKMSVKVGDQAVRGSVRGDGTMNLERVDGGFLGNTDVQVGEEPITPVCTVLGVTGPGGQPL